MLLFLNRDGRVGFKDNLSISELNRKLSFDKNNWVDYNIVSLQPCCDYADYEACIDFYSGLGAGSSIDYKRFIADCATKNLKVRSCFICRYHADANRGMYIWKDKSIFCKFLKEDCISTDAVKRQYFRKEDKYIKELLEDNHRDDFNI